MPLPHYTITTNPPITKPVFKPGRYLEYIYLGEDIFLYKICSHISHPSPVSTLKLKKNNIYRLYESQKQDEYSYYEEEMGFIYLFVNNEFFITKYEFQILIDCGAIMLLSKYRDKRINDILDE